MTAEPLQRAVEPVAGGGVVGIERERLLGVVGRLIGAPERVEDLREAHVLVGDHLTHRARGREQPEPLLPHLGGLLVLARQLQEPRQLGQRAVRGRRVVRRPRRRAREQVDGVGHARRAGARAGVGDRGLRSELVDDEPSGRVTEPRRAIVVPLVLGLDGERSHQDPRLVVAHQVPRERVAHRARGGLEGHRALQREPRALGIAEAPIEHLGALDEDPRAQADVAALRRRVRGRQPLQVRGELRRQIRILRGRHLAAQHRLQPAQRRRVLRQNAQRLGVGRARLRQPAQRLAHTRPLGPQIGLDRVALGHRDLVGEDGERARQLAAPFEQAADPRERRLQRARERVRRLVRGPRGRAIVAHTLQVQPELDVGARGADLIPSLAQELRAAAELTLGRRGRGLFGRRDGRGAGQRRGRRRR